MKAFRLKSKTETRSQFRRGEVSEWLKEHAWKACMRATVSRVRIPLSPPGEGCSAFMLGTFLLDEKKDLLFCEVAVGV